MTTFEEAYEKAIRENGCNAGEGFARSMFEAGFKGSMVSSGSKNERRDMDIKKTIKPLDFVRIKKDAVERTPVLVLKLSGPNKGESIAYEIREIDPEQKNVGLVTEVNREGGISIEWIGKAGLKNAWWNPDELEIVDSLPNLLVREMAHPFGNNKSSASEYYPIGG